MISVDINSMKSLIINSIQQNVYNQYSYLLNDYNIIHDFICICYFLGNDFIPHIPSLNINKIGLEYLIDVYVNTIYEINYNDNNNNLYLSNYDSSFNIPCLKTILKKI